MKKTDLRKVELGRDDMEKIGYSYFCLCCGKKVEVEDHYHDGGFEGTTYECDCKGANESARIRAQQKKLDEQLAQLRAKPKVQKELDRARFQAAVKAAAIEFNQPDPTFPIKNS